MTRQAGPPERQDNPAASDRTGQDTAVLTLRNPPDLDRPADPNRDNELLPPLSNS